MHAPGVYRAQVGPNAEVLTELGAKVKPPLRLGPTCNDQVSCVSETAAPQWVSSGVVASVPILYASAPLELS